MLVERTDRNPVLKPDAAHTWEAQGTLNGCPVRRGEGIDLLYRALSLPHHLGNNGETASVSTIGVATSKDGLDFYERRQLIAPEEEWESSGCEDPRVTFFDGRYYIFYTAIAKHPPGSDDIKVGIALSKDLRKIDEKHLVTPFNAKAMALFPDRAGGKVWTVLTVHTDRPPAKICLAPFEKPEDIWNRSNWEVWYKDFEKYSLPLVRKQEDHVEVGAPPIRTDSGWVLFYSYIRGYFTSNRLFTVEAVLLDLEDPTKIIGRTSYPLLAPEEYYEKVGYVPDVVFPSGALKVKNAVHLYYGAADTVCCVAFVDFGALVRRLSGKFERPKFLRAQGNPIISPRLPWEAKGTLNPAAVRIDGAVHIVYRAVSQDDTSVLGYARSADGVRIDYRSQDPIYSPRESFEVKHKPGNTGSEDPRLTLVGDRVYMCYTGLDGGNPPRVALTSIGAGAFSSMKWDWAKSVLISPPGADDKDACVFPEKVRDPRTGEKLYMIVHRLDNDIDYALTPTLEFDGKSWIEERRWIQPRRGYWDSVKVGLAAPPIKTRGGWIMLYHGVDEEKIYRVGAVLLSPENPLRVIGRSEEPLFEPEEKYEKEGIVSNVVFPCGAVTIGDKMYIYYGGADMVIGVAALETEKLLKTLLSS